MIASGSITAVAYLLAELLGAGVSINNILKEAKGTGIVPPERWNEIVKEMDGAEANWR